MAVIQLDMAKIEGEARKAEEACAAYVRCSLSWNWPGLTRCVRGSLRAEIVEGLEAQEQAVSASTKMFNWRYPALARVATLKREAIAFWKRNTVAWPEESGARLLPKAKVEEFEQRMRQYRDELARLAGEVQAVREQVVGRAKEQRGRAFSEAEYPADLSALFAVGWGYASLQVSEELKEISATAYSSEKTRQMARLLGAVRLAEEQSIRELYATASKLAARLEAVDAPAEEGRSRPPLCESMLEAVQEFCSRFSEVVCWGCDDLDEVVREAGGCVQGVSIEEIRADRELREKVAKTLSAAAGKLEGLIPALADEQAELAVAG